MLSLFSRTGLQAFRRRFAVSGRKTVVITLLAFIVAIVAFVNRHRWQGPRTVLSHKSVRLPQFLNPAIPYSPGQWMKVRTDDYVGAQSCAECHAKKFDSFQHTAHHLTSSLPSAESILGSFEPGHNEMSTAVDNLKVLLERRDDKFFQTAVFDDGNTHYTHSESIGIVTGSGKLGQTYLYWSDNHLFQLPASYLTSYGGWRNSPGFQDDEVNFARPISARCLECHATYARATPQALNSISPNNMVLGISCEKCHGPGRPHIEHHRQFPDDRVAKQIVHPGKLSAERQMDICMLCHSGIGDMLLPSFSFRPGMKLSEYLQTQPPQDEFEGSVHSNNQLVRLEKSRCFQESESMTCITCHDPHHHERGQTKLFSKRCQTCHSLEACGKFEEQGESIQKDCISCHMPRRGDPATQLTTAGSLDVPLMIDHKIGIYRELEPIGK